MKLTNTNQRKYVMDHGRERLSREGRYNTVVLRGQGENRAGRAKWGEEWRQR